VDTDDRKDLVLGLVDHEDLSMDELGCSVEEKWAKRRVLYSPSGWDTANDEYGSLDRSK
jgi:hypothetical protein